eukprot:COSAG01_NODE_32153_length_585_cov_2.353909_1_plen_59_part_01
MTVHEGASTHDGLGRAALVRRFKTLKPSHKDSNRGWVQLHGRVPSPTSAAMTTAPLRPG